MKSLKGNEHALKHGQHANANYPVWHGMMYRCYNKNSKKYKNYGGRGIKVCDRWHNVQNFLNDMGERPLTNMTLDRINVDGDYHKDNCRWADQKTQQNNRRNNRFVTLDGECKMIMEWELISGIPRKILLQRISRGDSLKKEVVLRPRTSKIRWKNKYSSSELVQSKIPCSPKT